MNKKILNAIDKAKPLMKAAADYIWKHPETGFEEWKTSKYMETEFIKLGYDIVKFDGIPGFYTVVDTGRKGKEVAVLAELDALKCTGHPEAAKNGAVHCCGHHAQCSAMIGIAAALKNEGIIAGLSGKIRLCVVPAEEGVSREVFEKLFSNNVIKYSHGKMELMRRKCFDGVDITFMAHTTADDYFSVDKGNVGCLEKRVTYYGTAAHAGAAPWSGCNALNAAIQGITSVNAMRETFKDSDLIRVASVIEGLENPVNIIPDKVCVRSQIRATTLEAIKDTNKKVNRAFCGAALSIGANIEIEDFSIYAPLTNDRKLITAAEEALAIIKPDVALNVRNSFFSASTDMGDLSQIMPVVQLNVPGASGLLHGNDFKIKNFDLACCGSAAWQLAFLYVLLGNNGSKAKETAEAYEKKFSDKDEFFDVVDKMLSRGRKITYQSDDTAIVQL